MQLYDMLLLIQGFPKLIISKVKKMSQIVIAYDLLLFPEVQLSPVPLVLHPSPGDQLYHSSQEALFGLAPLVHLGLLDHHPNPKIQNNIISKI